MSPAGSAGSVGWITGCPASGRSGLLKACSSLAQGERIEHVDRSARLPRQQLLDRNAEVVLVSVLLDVADMRRRQDVVQAKQRMVGAVDRLPLLDGVRGGARGAP